MQSRTISAGRIKQSNTPPLLSRGRFYYARQQTGGTICTPVIIGPFYAARNATTADGKTPTEKPNDAQRAEKRGQSGRQADNAARPGTHSRARSHRTPHSSRAGDGRQISHGRQESPPATPETPTADRPRRWRSAQPAQIHPPRRRRSAGHDAVKAEDARTVPRGRTRPHARSPGHRSAPRVSLFSRISPSQKSPLFPKPKKTKSLFLRLSVRNFQKIFLSAPFCDFSP